MPNFYEKHYDISMNSDKLSKHLTELRTEINKIEETDKPTALRLQDLVDDIENTASAESSDNVMNMIENLEEKHPAVTEVLNRIATVLSNMGV